MLRKDIRKSAFQSGVFRSTADPSEIARFETLADEWWRPNGAFKVVHAFNAARVSYLSDVLPRFSDRSVWDQAPLSGLSILDVGCGAGIVTEPVSLLGGRVLGIDAAERNIVIASRHASAARAPVQYRHALPEELEEEGQSFDIVLSLEVVEHVASVAAFLSSVSALVKPGGLLVLGTINRTVLSYLKAIIGAEYILGWLPKGTHDWKKFVTPVELQADLSPLGFSVLETRGVELNPLTMRWRIGASIDATYLQVYRKDVDA